MQKHYYDPDICRKCGGKCCKGMPAPYTPRDIRRRFPAATLQESVRLALETDTISIDWWEGDHSIPFVRPATKERAGCWYDASWGGECIYLGSNGCTLAWRDRPHYCKTVEPKGLSADGRVLCNNHLKQNNSKWYAARLWRKADVNLWQWENERV